MFVVAITELAGGIEAEAPLLAADIGASAYDARLLLAPGAPVVVRTTADRAAALYLLAKLRARGLAAVACDAAAVVASADMVAMRRPRLAETVLTLEDRPGEALPYDDILVMIPAVHRGRAETTTQTREKKLSVSRALVTGGVSLTKTVKTDTHAATEARESVLYVFRRSGATPWILREQGTNWSAAGIPLAPSASENFRLAVARLRSLAQGAAFDERLATRKAAERMAMSGNTASTTVRSSSEAGVDLLAHLLALATAKGAYR